jgi:hypothetical protein
MKQRVSPQGPIRLFRIALLLCTQLLGTAASAGDYRVNGVAITVEEALVRGSTQELASELMRRWRRARPAAPISRHDTPGRVILGRVRDSLHQSVTLRTRETGQHIEIISAVTNLVSRPRRLPAVPLLPAGGLRIVSVVEALGANPAITFTGLSMLSMPALADAASRAAGAGGWLRLPLSPQPLPATAQMIWIRGTQSILLQLHPQGAGARFVLVEQRPQSPGAGK